MKDYFEYIIKKYGERTDNPRIGIYIYINKIDNSITFRIKTGYFQLSTSEQ